MDEDLARGPAHRLAPAIPVLAEHGVHSGIDLARRRRADVVPDAAAGLGAPPQEGPGEIGASGDDLGSQGVLVPAERDLSNALQIGVERRDLDHRHAIGFCRDPEGPPVAPITHLQVCVLRHRDFDHCALGRAAIAGGAMRSTNATTARARRAITLSLFSLPAIGAAPGAPRSPCRCGSPRRPRSCPPRADRRAPGPPRRGCLEPGPGSPRAARRPG